MTDTAAQVRAIVAAQLCQPIDEVTDERTFASMGADSLDEIELAMALEDAFAIAIPDGDIEEAGTVGAAIAVVERAADRKRMAGKRGKA